MREKENPMKYRLSWEEAVEYDQAVTCRSHQVENFSAENDDEAKNRARAILEDEYIPGEGDDDVVRLEARVLVRIDREEETTLILL